MQDFFKKVSYWEIEYGKLEQLIQSEYGHPYEFPYSEEADNGSSQSFHVHGNMTKWDIKILEVFKNTGSGNFLAAIFLNDMAARGLIEKGNYLVSVCW